MKPKQRPEKKSVLSSVISEGSDTGINSEYTEMTEAVAKNRKAGAMSPVGSSSILTHTQDGKMDIVIPGNDKRK